MNWKIVWKEAVVAEFKLLSQDSAARTGGRITKCPSAWSVYGPRFEPGTCRIRSASTRRSGETYKRPDVINGSLA
jgi:hypothetical protein